MEDSTTREKVLKKIRAALLSKSSNPYPRIDYDSAVFATSDEDPLLIFADQLTAAGGHFILCDDDLEFVEGIRAKHPCRQSSVRDSKAWDRR